MLAQGPRVAAFEDAFTRLTDTRHAIATSSGTTALHLALLAHGIGPGDEVITSPFTFIASVNTILFTGATPVFADIQEGTFNIDPNWVEAAITPRTKALMPVHLYGQPCDMDEITALADKHGIAIIEDAAQAIGATYGGRQAGSFGTGCFSLYAASRSCLVSVEVAGPLPRRLAPAHGHFDGRPVALTRTFSRCRDLACARPLPVGGIRRQV